MHEMENRTLACHLTYIKFRDPLHENRNLNFICHLADIFIGCMFLTGKMAFDGHDTHQIFALVGATSTSYSLCKD